MKTIGHRKQWEFLKNSFESDKLSHAYIFSGQKKLGKRTVALELASLITNSANLNQNPDFVFIESQNQKILIDQIRDLIWRMSLKSPIDSFKIAVIDDAHLMGIDAQHAILKTLEEPKGKSVMILISEKPELLLPTISSRCEMVKFYLVSNQEILEYLKDKTEEEKIKEIIELSGGRPGEAIDFIEYPEKLKQRKVIINKFNELINSSLAERFKYAKELSQKDDHKEEIEIWISFLRNKLIESVRDENVESIIKIKKSLNVLQRINSLIASTNINAKLAIENILLSI